MPRIAIARQADGYPHVALYTRRDRSATHEIPRGGEPTPAPLVHIYIWPCSSVLCTR